MSVAYPGFFSGCSETPLAMIFIKSTLMTHLLAPTELNRALPIGHLMSPSWAILLEASGGDPRDVQPKGCDVTVLNYVRRRHTREPVPNTV